MRWRTLLKINDAVLRCDHKLINDVFYSYYDSLLNKYEYLSPKYLMKMQLDRLNTLLSYSRNNSYFWRERLRSLKNLFPLQDLSSLALIPPLTKEEVREHFIGLHANPNTNKHFCILSKTSGSTGTPLWFYNDSRFYLFRRGTYRRILRWVGKDHDDQVVWIRSFKGFPEEAAQIMLSDPNDLDVTFKRIIELSTKHTLVLDGMVSVLVSFAEYVKQNKREVPIRAIIAVGEAITHSEREFIREVLAAPVYNRYGTNENGILAFECGGVNGLHIMPEDNYIEIVDENNQLLSPGRRGRILITTLVNTAMPFIRYEIGDFGTMLVDKCSCGRTLPRLMVDGRTNRLINLSNGNSVFLVAVEQYFARHFQHVREFQIIEERPGQFIFCIVPAASIPSAIHDRIISDMQKYFRYRAKIEIKFMSEIPYPRLPGEKKNVFISHEVYKTFFH